MRKLTTKEFIERAKAVHGDKYDYSNVKYVDSSTKVHITCLVHGDFWQAPYNHLEGGGCPECGKLSRAKSRMNGSDSVLRRFREVHGYKYDYSKMMYKGGHTKVEIICPTHGSFWQTPNSHSRGRGCPRCGYENRLSTRKDQDTVVENFRSVHGDKYDYSRVRYKDVKTPVEIICPLHGAWEVTPNNHLRGRGCPLCANIESGKRKLMSKEAFVEKSVSIHGDKYDYSKTDLSEGVSAKSLITCPIHGDFEQNLQGHLQGYGCPRCTHNGKSKAEGVLEELIKSWLPDLKVERNVRGIIPEFTTKKRGEGRKTIKNGELDLYVPEKKLAIEYNGMFWHSRDRVGWDYHVNKRKACDQVGIRMITIWEADWQDERKRPILERYLKHALGIKDERTVYARKCVIRDVPQREYREFMDKNHIQGYASAKEVKKGLYTKDGELVACMSFKKLKNRDVKEHPHTIWNMVRYATSCNVPGGRSKLFKHIREEYHMDHVESHLDRDYFTGQSYLKEDGWELVEDTQATLGMWHPRFGRQSRQAWWHAAIPRTLEKLGLPRDLYDPNLTQDANAEKAGVLFFNNSGNARFEWHSEEGLADPVYQDWLKGRKGKNK